MNINSWWKWLLTVVVTLVVFGLGIVVGHYAWTPSNAPVVVAQSQTYPDFQQLAALAASGYEVEVVYNTPATVPVEVPVYVPVEVERIPAEEPSKGSKASKAPAR
ncbi:MAG: hypothetical protein WC752_03330 [Patescibacteria group bacterium]